MGTDYLLPQSMNFTRAVLSTIIIIYLLEIIGVLRHTGKGKEKVSLQESLLSQGFVIVSKNGFL